MINSRTQRLMILLQYLNNHPLNNKIKRELEERERKKKQPTRYIFISIVIVIRSMNESSVVSFSFLLLQSLQQKVDEAVTSEKSSLLPQPSLATGGVMRDYQLIGVNWLIGLWENGMLLDVLSSSFYLPSHIVFVCLFVCFNDTACLSFICVLA
jgi:SNF2 family DNA or RNA helicase